MAQIVKLAIAGTTLTAIGGGAAYAGGLFHNPQPEKIVVTNTKSRLFDEGFQVLDPKGNSAEWATVLASYIKATKGTFKEGGAKDADRTKESLISECEKQFALNTDSSYTLARQWCVKEESVSAIIGKKYTLLTTSQENPEEKVIWTQKVSSLKANTESKFESLKAKLKDASTDAATLRSECEKLKPNDIKTTSDTFGDVFEQTREFCSKNKN